ncbi:putative Peptidase S8 and S53 subtilisin kexin sedolisin [metagenome]|uniref:Putative Peptidase S8 and S53 subtilisin kexin sedolisin n=1 Tax=metagenome TaxID=256318 RepID=A0A2P2C1I0_9ZZZZ
MATADEPKRDPLNDKELRELARIQVAIIVEALGRDQVGWDSEDPADFTYLFRRESVLVRDRDVERVTRYLGDRSRVADNLVNGLTRLAVSGGQPLPELVTELDVNVGIGVATPDHILHVSPGRCCPATEPAVPKITHPRPKVSRNSEAGCGVFVSVVDTGWWEDAESDPVSPWLEGVTGDPEVIDQKHIHPYAGHGTFIAGVIRCEAPATEIRVEGFLPKGGAIFESDMTVQLVQALSLGPDIISLSAGSTTRADRPPLSFEVFWENFLSQVKGTVLVAAAGNDATRAPFWPAAFPWSISVGALDAAGKRADFSNYGSWVDVSALGVDLVNAYPRGTFVTHEPPVIGEVREFEGLARWSGTSFSTPLVVGKIAARMSKTGLSARLAADQLLAEARAKSKPGVGPWL